MKASFLGLFIFCLATCTSCSSPEKEDDKSAESNGAASVQSTNQYPDLLLKLTDGEEISTRKLKGKNVFVLFQPDCDHCQEEAVMIEQRIKDFEGYTLYFISSAPVEQIKSFAETFQLHNKPNVNFAWTSTEGVLTHYGPIPTPSVYIYADGKLKRSFNGQTDIDTILGAL